jgi:hypothetical protein
MKKMLKTIVGWEQKSEPEKAAFFQRFEFFRYRLFYLASFLLCFFPIPMAFLLRICLSDKQQPFEHDYGHTYGALFWRFKYRPIRLVEIGIGGYGNRLGGESLNAWQSYFPFATIIGCDIQDKSRLTTPRTKIYLLDQSSNVQLEEFCKKERPFDIVIDDGSHLSAHQIGTFKMLFTELKPRGLYIIEDVQTSYWSHGGYDGASIKDAKFDGTCVGYFLRLAKYLNHQEFMASSEVDGDMLALAKSIKQIIFEHNLIIMAKGDNLI